MATYDEVHGIYVNNPHTAKIKVALGVAADTIQGELVSVENHAERVKWAAAAMSNPERETERFSMAVLAKNNALTAQQIIDLNDAAIQADVDYFVNLYAVADHGP